MSNIIFRDIKNPCFEICGLYNPLNESTYRRLPEEVAKATSPNVTALHVNTAGGRIRFKTDANVLYIRAKGDAGVMYHTTPFMVHGFDVYVDGGREPIYMGGGCPTWDEDLEKLTHINLPAGEKEITVNMPLYGSVSACELGLPEEATISPHSPYQNDKPVVFYGSSITQGACASRPGRAYQAIISRKYNLDYTNLGFSGSAKAEDAMVEYLASLEMSAFVSDYDHNAPTHEHLRDTHFKMYQRIREKHPDIPYFMITKPDFRFDGDSQARRAIVMESYVKAYMAGDRNVYFIDGSAFFNGRPESELTMDRCHPNDEGMGRMADYIGDVIAKVMGL